ncbi:TetR/AcrR family transcriptional regulator [Sphingomonas sp. So64.6b]|uniref:TetR/AcrR family transcriptional regulator n=1 Tax=Sphingomonas sp. So64.6b TaxID=2997354 RepID=UPI0016002CC7|nr:TetR/AcrR family transcriptional regulator [Sphingomonas sp. So64.6b]QNA85662.1 TetR/AcrR family transcriptional regulator [Sphingomonas sp. So64.6b]
MRRPPHSAVAPSEPAPAIDGTRLSRGEMYDLVWSKPMTTIASELGLSGNGLAKICDRLLVPYPTRGYWAKVYAGKDEAQAPLPAAPPGTELHATIAPARSRSRRPRLRLTREERREKILAQGEALVRSEGVHAVSMKRVARELGMSEAQSYNYFNSAAELLAAIARSELVEMNKARLAASRQCTDPQMRYTLTTLAYLRQVATRGEVLQRLLALPDVRAILRGEHEDRRNANRKVFGDVYQEAYRVPPQVSTIVGAMLTAVSLRGGRLLARGKIDLETAERLVMPAIGGGQAHMIDRYGSRS